MPDCCVPLCNSKTENNIRLFTLPRGPRNKKRRDQWIKLIKREVLPVNAYVCEFHFTEDQFENNRIDNKRLLKSSAVPTVQKTTKDISGMKVENELDSMYSTEEEGGKVKYNNFVKCRTCLLNKNREKCSVMKKLFYGETIRHMLIKCVPQMSSTLADDNHICDKCLRCLVKCYKFVIACLDVESKIQEGKVTFESENTAKEITNKRYSENIMNEEDKISLESKMVGKDIKLQDSQKIGNNQNDVQVKGKRKRKTRMIEDSAAEEDIEAYLAEEQSNSESEIEKPVRTIARRQSNKAERKSNDNEIERKKSKLIEKWKLIEKEKSPEMEIIDKTLGMVAKTYQRKRILVNPEENKEVLFIPQSRSIEQIGENIEPPPRTQLRTYERKGRNSLTAANQFFKEENKICDTVNIDCDMISSEHTLGLSLQTDFDIRDNIIINKNNDYVNEINVDHDYIVLTESGKNLVSVVKHEVSEDTRGEVLQEQTPQNENTVELNCPSCQTHYKTSRDLRDHLKIFHGINEEDYVYHCQVCEEEFKNSEEMLEHKNSHGWCCSLCTGIFSSSEELNSHNKDHPRSFTCTHCGKTFDSKSMMEQHQSIHKIISDIKQQKMEPPPKRFHCDSCTMVFRYPMRLRMHRNLVHLKLKNYKCHDCGKRFGTKNTLLVHNRVKHQDHSPFHCDVCGDSFKRKDYLKKHSSIHHYEQLQLIISANDEKNGANMSPQFFDMPWKNKISARKPLFTYAKVRNYTCRVCGLKFFNQRSKFIHECSHIVEDDKKFGCPYCWKRLGTKKELDGHCKRHIKISKNYKCRHCSMKFVRNNFLENHIRAVHPSEDKSKVKSIPAPVVIKKEDMLMKPNVLISLR